MECDEERDAAVVEVPETPEDDALYGGLGGTLGPAFKEGSGLPAVVDEGANCRWRAPKAPAP